MSKPTEAQYADAYQRYFNRQVQVSTLAWDLGVSTAQLYIKFSDIRRGLPKTPVISSEIVGHVLHDRGTGDLPKVIADRYGLPQQTVYSILGRRVKGKPAPWAYDFGYRVARSGPATPAALRGLAAVAVTAEDFWEVAAVATRAALASQEPSEAVSGVYVDRIPPEDENPATGLLDALESKAIFTHESLEK